MAGLLDMLDSPEQLGLLSLGLRLMSTPGSRGQAFGQAGMGAIGDIQSLMQAKEAKKRADLQSQMLMLQLEQQKRAAEGEKAAQSYMAQAMAEPDADMAPDMPGPRREPAGFDLGSALKARVPLPAALQLAEQFRNTTPQPIKVGKDERLGISLPGGKWHEIVSAAPEKPEKIDPNKPFLLIDGKIVPNPAYQEYAERVAKAGSTNNTVSVNTGQKGYENESKLRNDFKSEPIYKDFQDMQAAHKQIKAGIAQGTPIGDVATATKIMKLLDPGSVVRESELGIAMAAGGRMDRLQNYVQMQISGEKLTPQMRKDFGALADELYKAASQAYNKKRAEYEQMGTRYGLDPSVLGSPAGEGVRRFNPTTGRIE